MKKFSLVGIGALVLLVAAWVLAAGQSSDNYEIPLDVISGGGEPSLSDSYRNNGSLGQPSPLGGATTTSYANYPGFWQAHECLFDPDSDLLSDCAEWYLGTNPNNDDSDGDELNDGEEVNSYLTDPMKADTDGDGVDDGAEALTYGTEPLDPDSDDDFMLDGWEIDHPLCLDPLDPSDGDALLDSDTDGLANLHEYYNDLSLDGNTSDPCDDQQPRQGQAGRGYFGDADGDLFIGVLDLNLLKAKLNGQNPDYSNVFPADPLIQDMDGDGSIGVLDKNLLSTILNGNLTGTIAGSPTELSLVAPLSPPTVAVGATVRIQVELTNGKDNPSPGFGVVFTIVSGTATLWGGEGVADGGRYDLTALDGVAQLVVRVDGSETPIVVQVSLPGDAVAHTLELTGLEVEINVVAP